jgi:hypothetical protein
MKKLLLNSKSIAIVLVVMNLFIAGAAIGQTNTFDGSSSNNWNTAANWSLNHVPLATEDVVIPNSFAVTVNTTTAVCNSLAITGGFTDCSVTIASPNTLTVTNAITIGAGTGNGDDQLLNVGSGTVSCASIAVTATGSGARRSGITISSGTLTVSGSITMGDANDELTFTGAGTVNIGGNLTGGNFTRSTGTVNYNGTTQTVGAYIYNNLTISGGGTKTLAGTTTVNAGLTLTSGILAVPTGSTLTLTSTNQVAGTFSATNNIFTQVNTGTGAKGTVRVNVPAATARTIPVSDGTNYLPVTINATNASGYNVTVFNGVTTDATPNGTAFGAGPKKEIVDAVWNIGLASGTGTGVSLTLGWQGALEGSTFAATTLTTQAGIAQNTAGIWANPQQNGGVLHTSSTRTGLTVAATSSFAVGKIYPAGGTLPIKVVYFNAAKGNGYNTLNWSAESTSESATFDIERSADGKNFTAISTINATRFDMSQPFSYVDNSNLTGTVYYRIKITDFNGKVTYSSVVRIATAVNDMKLVAVLPNPVSNTAQLNVVSAKKDNVQLSVVSMTGQLVQRSTVQLQSGSSIINLDVANLQSGMYTIKGTFSDGTVSTVKFVKQ